MRKRCQIRGEIKLRLLWSLVPLVPLSALFGVELTAAWLSSNARELARQGRAQEAIQIRQRVLAIPTRSVRVENYIGLGHCYLALGELEQAEKSLLQAQNVANGAYGPSYYLARFYTHRRCRQTRYFRPDKAEALLTDIRDGPHTQRVRSLARRVLDEMRKEGLIR